LAAFLVFTGAPHCGQYRQIARVGAAGSGYGRSSDQLPDKDQLAGGVECGHPQSQ
jgi:hypothetical protein